MKYSIEELREIVAKMDKLIAGGLTHAQAADKLSIGRSSYTWFKKRIAASAAGEPAKQYTDEERAALIRKWEALKAQGKRYDDAADDVGVQYSLLYQWQKRPNIAKLLEREAPESYEEALEEEEGIRPIPLEHRQTVIAEKPPVHRVDFHLPEDVKDLLVVLVGRPEHVNQSLDTLARLWSK